MANLVIDIGSACRYGPSVINASNPVNSGVVVGVGVDMLLADTLCNVCVTAGTSQSGVLSCSVQESDDNLSGSYTNVNTLSGTWFWLSGGRFTVQSSGIGQSGTGLVSGFTQYAAFQRQRRYVRAVVESGGGWNSTLSITFASQLLYDGSGGGYSISPATGPVFV